MIVIGNPEEIRALVAPQTGKKPTPILLRAQESGPCVHYDPHLKAHCTYPYDRACPHLDNPEILCPVKDSCAAMAAILRMQYGPATEPEFPALVPEEEHTYTIQLPPEAKRKDAWTEIESWVVAGEGSWEQAIRVYRAKFPDSKRTDKAIKSRWIKLRPSLKPAPAEPVEDLDPDERDPDQMVSAEPPALMDTGNAPIYKGDTVALVTAPEQVGTVAFINARTGYASVEYPDGGPARVHALADLRRVIA